MEKPTLKVLSGLSDDALKNVLQRHGDLVDVTKETHRYTDYVFAGRVSKVHKPIPNGKPHEYRVPGETLVLETISLFIESMKEWHFRVVFVGEIVSSLNNVKKDDIIAILSPKFFLSNKIRTLGVNPNNVVVWHCQRLNVFGTRNNKLANKNHKGEGEGTSMYSYTDWSDDTDKDPNYEPLARSTSRKRHQDDGDDASTIVKSLNLNKVYRSRPVHLETPGTSYTPKPMAIDYNCGSANTKQFHKAQKLTAYASHCRTEKNTAPEKGIPNTSDCNRACGCDSPMKSHCSNKEVTYCRPRCSRAWRGDMHSKCHSRFRGGEIHDHHYYPSCSAHACNYDIHCPKCKQDQINNCICFTNACQSTCVYNHSCHCNSHYGTSSLNFAHCARHLYCTDKSSFSSCSHPKISSLKSCHNHHITKTGCSSENYHQPVISKHFCNNLCHTDLSNSCERVVDDRFSTHHIKPCSGEIRDLEGRSRCVYRNSLPDTLVEDSTERTRAWVFQTRAANHSICRSPVSVRQPLLRPSPPRLAGESRSHDDSPSQSFPVEKAFLKPGARKRRKLFNRSCNSSVISVHTVVEGTTPFDSEQSVPKPVLRYSCIDTMPGESDRAHVGSVPDADFISESPIEVNLDSANRPQNNEPVTNNEPLLTNILNTKKIGTCNSIDQRSDDDQSYTSVQSGEIRIQSETNNNSSPEPPQLNESVNQGNIVMTGNSEHNVGRENSRKNSPEPAQSCVVSSSESDNLIISQEDIATKKKTEETNDEDLEKRRKESTSSTSDKFNLSQETLVLDHDPCVLLHGEELNTPAPKNKVVTSTPPSSDGTFLDAHSEAESKTPSEKSWFIKRLENLKHYEDAVKQIEILNRTPTLKEPLSFTPYDKCSVYGVILDLIPSVDNALALIKGWCHDCRKAYQYEDFSHMKSTNKTYCNYCRHRLHYACPRCTTAKEYEVPLCLYTSFEVHLFIGEGQVLRIEVEHQVADEFLGCPPANIIKNPRRVSESLKSLIATPDVLKKDNEVVHLKATIITKQRADIIFLTFCNTSLKKDIYSKGNRKKFVVIK